MPSRTAFLPPHLVRYLAASRGSMRLPRVVPFRAALLFSDISGFTELSERLQSEGPAGAEEIARLVDEAFRPAIRIIRRLDGSICSFGGDSLLTVFPGRDGVDRAREAAGRIADHLKRRGFPSRRGEVRVRVAQAIHYGTVRGLHLGREERRHYLLVGPPLRTLARLQREAGPDDVAVSTAARRQSMRRRGRPSPSAVPRLPNRRIDPYLQPRLVSLLGSFEGEYRRAGVLFLETASERKDDLQRFFVALAEQLDRYEGVLLKTDLSAHGTKWLCVFGLPTAHENDVDRAARVGLQLRGQLSERMRLRGAVHSGLVVNVELGTRDRRSFDIMGDPVNTAARLLERADWGEFVISSEARRALTSARTRYRGRYRIRGKADALAIHTLLGARADAHRPRLKTPHVGRSSERRELRQALREVSRSGRGLACGVRGEAGVGKSRLKWEVSRSARRAGFDVLEGRAVPVHGTSYWAVAELLRGSLPSRDESAAIDEECSRLGLSDVDRAHLRRVLGHTGAPTALSPEVTRNNELLAVQRYLEARAGERPLMVILEDLHWADEGTRETIRWLCPRISARPVMLLLLFRPGYTPPDETRMFDLEELSREDAGRLVELLMGPASVDLVTLLTERAGGNPFYLQELVQHLIEAGMVERSDGCWKLVRAPDSEDLPATIDGVLRARLDTLSRESRQLVQLASVVGRSFSSDLLRRLSRLDAASWQSCLRELERFNLVFETTERPGTYIFRHALVRDVAYGAILLSRRREVHRAVAEQLESGEGVELQQGVLGHHWEHAGEPERAARCYRSGARRARENQSLSEAAALFTSYLRLVDAETVEAVDTRIELSTQVLVATGKLEEARGELARAALTAARLKKRRHCARATSALGEVEFYSGNWSGAEASLEQALSLARAARDRATEARTLRRLGSLFLDRGRIDEAEATLLSAREATRRAEPAALAETLHALGNLRHRTGRMDAARSLYGDALALAREHDRIAMQARVMGALGNLHREQGELEEAAGHYRESLEIARSIGDRFLECLTLINLGTNLWSQSQRHQARSLYRKARDLALELGRAQAASVAVGNLALLEQSLGDPDAAFALQEEAVRLKREIGDRRGEAVALNNLALSHTTRGNHLAGLASAHRALAINREIRAVDGQAYVLSCLGNILIALGRLKEAGVTFRQAVGQARKVGLVRIEGKSILGLALLEAARGRPRSARRLFDRSLHTIRQSGEIQLVGECLLHLAEQELRFGADPSAVESILTDAEAVDAADDGEVSGIHDHLLSVRGHQTLARGESARAVLDRAARLADAGAIRRAEHSDGLRNLTRSQEAFEAGRPLVNGFHPAHLSRGQLRWLRRNRPTSLPPELR